MRNFKLYPLQFVYFLLVLPILQAECNLAEISNSETSAAFKTSTYLHRRQLFQKTKDNEEKSAVDRVEIVYESSSCDWNTNLNLCDISIIAAADYYLQVEVPAGAEGRDNLVDMAFSLTDCSIETDEKKCLNRPECAWMGAFCDSVLFKMPNACFGKAGDVLRRNCTGISVPRACDRVTGCIYNKSKKLCGFDLREFFEDIRQRPVDAPVGVYFTNSTRSRLLRLESRCMNTKDPEKSCNYPCFYDSDMAVCTLDKNYLVQSLTYRRTSGIPPTSCSIYDAVIHDHPAVPLKEKECVTLQDDNGPCQWNPTSRRCLPSQLSIFKAISDDEKLTKRFENTQNDCNEVTTEKNCGRLS